MAARRDAGDQRRPAAGKPATGDDAPGRRFWIGAAAGGLVMLHGLTGLARQAGATRPVVWALWLGAVLAAHDLVLVPAVLLAGRLLRRAAGPALWPPLRGALIISGIVALVTVPALVGDGRATDPTNPSLLPNDYPRSLALVVALILAVVGALAAIAVRGRRRDPRPARSRPPGPGP